MLKFSTNNRGKIKLQREKAILSCFFFIGFFVQCINQKSTDTSKSEERKKPTPVSDKQEAGGTKPLPKKETAGGTKPLPKKETLQKKTYQGKTGLFLYPLDVRSGGFLNPERALKLAECYAAYYRKGEKTLTKERAQACLEQVEGANLVRKKLEMMKNRGVFE